MSRPWITPAVVIALAVAVPRRAAMVWLYLWSRADANTGNTFPNVRTIGRELGIKPGHVSEDVKRLETAGWLLVDRTRGKNEYTVIVPRDMYPETGTTCAPKQEQVVPQEGNTILTLPETLPVNLTKNLRKRSKPCFDPSDLDTAEWMFALIRKLDDKAKKPQIELWANEIRLLRAVDGRDDVEIRRVFRWANEHEFWKTNILSPRKLRDKFTTLALQSRSLHGNTRKGHSLVGDGQRHPADANRDF